MSIISYDFGHMEGNGGVCQDTSANGHLYEYTVNRGYGQVAVDVLKNAGHTLINCTPPDGSCSTLGESLFYRANKSNQSGAVLHLCFHANCVDDENSHGAEVEYSSSKGAEYAQSVLNEICKLGFNSRGIKNPSLYMTGSHVNAVSILLEPFFISNQKDCSLYNPITLGNAVAKGVLNVIGGNYNPVINSSTTTTIQPLSVTTDITLKSQIQALQYNLNLDYNAKLAHIDGNIYQELLDNLESVGKNLIKKGHKSHVVLWIQQKLVGYGYLKKGTYQDMIYDEPTFQAVTNMQKGWGRETSGIITVSNRTWEIFLNNK